MSTVHRYASRRNPCHPGFSRNWPTPTPNESLRFYTDVLGLELTEQAGQSAYLRGWGEFFHHSVQLTEAPLAGVGHVGWRTFGPDELSEAVTRLERSGQGAGWHEDSLGHGPAYRYHAPHGRHLHEVFWEVDRYEPPPELAPTYPNRPQRYLPRGAAVRSLDHVTIACENIMGDVQWYRDTLGHRFTEYIVAEDNHDFVVFAMLTTVHLAHDMAIVFDHSGVPARVNHVAFWVDQREELRRATDVLIEMDHPIEFGPGRHGMGEQDYVYVREPSGFRIELNAGGYRNYAPDWEPVKWTPSQGSNSVYRNIAMPESMLESFPSTDVTEEQRVVSGLFV
jgi:catechol 2,3-dioxygenase